MLSDTQINRIRTLAAEGTSKAEIARQVGCSTASVRKYLSFEGPAPRREKHGRADCAPSLAPYRELIEQWVQEDEGKRRKHRKTATQIWQRLREEHGYTGAYSLVQHLVSKLKKALLFKEMSAPDPPYGAQ